MLEIVSFPKFFRRGSRRSELASENLKNVGRAPLPVPRQVQPAPLGHPTCKATREDRPTGLATAVARSVLAALSQTLKGEHGLKGESSGARIKQEVTIIESGSFKKKINVKF